MREADRLRLLAVDSLVNLALGFVLLVLPNTTISFFGLPAVETTFYVTVLGAVLFGIGVALWVERRNVERWRGLGLVGAVIINVFGAGTVLVWLIIDPFDLPARGYFVLWAVVVLVIGAALVEILAIGRRDTT